MWPRFLCDAALGGNLAQLPSDVNIGAPPLRVIFTALLFFDGGGFYSSRTQPPWPGLGGSHEIGLSYIDQAFAAISRLSLSISLTGCSHIWEIHHLGFRMPPLLHAWWTLAPLALYLFPFKQLTPTVLAVPSTVGCDSNCRLRRLQRVVSSAATSHRVNVICTLMSEQKAGWKRSWTHTSGGSLSRVVRRLRRTGAPLNVPPFMVQCRLFTGFRFCWQFFPMASTSNCALWFRTSTRYEHHKRRVFLFFVF